MQAFHNDPSVKAKYLARVEAHRNKTDKMVLRLLSDGRIEADLATGMVVSNQQRRKVLGCRNLAGYLVAGVHDGDEYRQVKLHRVVWLASGRDIMDEHVIDHINRIKHDNRLCNLRTVTTAANSRNRRSYCGHGNPAARLTAEMAERIRRRHAILGSYQKVCDEFGVSRSLVAQIVRGELWSA